MLLGVAFREQLTLVRSSTWVSSLHMGTRETTPFPLAWHLGRVTSSLPRTSHSLAGSATAARSVPGSPGARSPLCLALGEEPLLYPESGPRCLGAGTYCPLSQLLPTYVPRMRLCQLCQGCGRAHGALFASRVPWGLSWRGLLCPGSLGSVTDLVSSQGLPTLGVSLQLLLLPCITHTRCSHCLSSAVLAVLAAAGSSRCCQGAAMVIAAAAASRRDSSAALAHSCGVKSGAEGPPVPSLAPTQTL